MPPRKDRMLDIRPLEMSDATARDELMLVSIKVVLNASPSVVVVVLLLVVEFVVVVNAPNVLLLVSLVVTAIRR